ncbi:Hypothetical predicted protein [Lecanosticta acicola]|uniref:Uncharacterized protein n=1 Tax=Lecanosticta acicola TaxID=111012 RepID=A0AAI8YVY3_9PEZI|nr:Hypothetical predicted protein [Lecanosticta acicola]
MKFDNAAVLALAAGASAQNMSICDKYTTALLKENTAMNQQTLLTLVVNTAVIGNYTKPNVGIAVPGLLAPGTGKYAGVNLLPYFNGMLASTNSGGSMGISVNFLDGGGATPLMNNTAANNTSSAQYRLLTHLYEYFGYLLGCSQFGMTTMPYAGSTNMYQVHKFMALDVNEVGWFIQNVGLSAASFGVSNDDVMAVGTALNNAFGYRCSPAMSIPKTATAEPQSICIADDCPISPNATCSLYSPVVKPMKANSTTSGAGSTASSGAMSSSSVQPFTGAASSFAPVGATLAAAVFGLAAYLL